MPNLLQLSQSYTNEDSINYKYAWLREEVESGFKDLGDLAYDDQVEVAKLGNSILQGGYFKTELIDVLAMRIGDENSNVYVNKDGINVKDGNIIVRDSSNKSIITSNGLKMKYLFVSNGEISGWQRGGIYEDIDGITSYGNSLFVYTPSDFIVDSAKLHINSLPYHLYDQQPTSEGGSGAPDGIYHVRGIRLYEIADALDAHIPVVGHHMYTEPSFGTKTDISSTMGGTWNPSGNGIKTIIADVSDYINIGGKSVFAIESNLAKNYTNTRYQSGIKMELEIEGFLRG